MTGTHTRQPELYQSKQTNPFWLINPKRTSVYVKKSRVQIIIIPISIKHFDQSNCPNLLGTYAEKVSTSRGFLSYFLFFIGQFFPKPELETCFDVKRVKIIHLWIYKVRFVPAQEFHTPFCYQRQKSNVQKNNLK